jgi:hypothetical protein
VKPFMGITYQALDEITKADTKYPHHGTHLVWREQWIS